MSEGLELAEAAYGASVLKLLNSAIEMFGDDDYKKQCLTELEVRNKHALDDGLSRLTRLLEN